MKINVLEIVQEHLKTLCNTRKPFSCLTDLSIFFLFPIAAGTAAFFVRMPLDREVYNVTITFFGIFTGLLLNVQVAMFAIFQRQWHLPTDPKSLPGFNARYSERRSLLAELNTNLSYLTVFCCASLVAFFCFFTFNNMTPTAVGCSVAILLHFLATLMMTIKRSHILFSKEYVTA